MYSMMLRILFLAFSVASCSACAQQKGGRSADDGARTVEVCGVVFPKSPTIILMVAPLPESFANSRVNQERYDACPYTVVIKLAASSMNLDFSDQVTLRDVEQLGLKNQVQHVLRKWPIPQPSPRRAFSSPAFFAAGR